MPGPPPKRNAVRHNANRGDWIELPGDGYAGRTPRWPLPGRAPRGWAALWRLPQAYAWAGQGLDRVVARYAYLLAIVEHPDDERPVSAALLAEVRQIEDRLGLSPMAMKRLQWTVGPRSDDKAKAPNPGKGGAGKVANLDDFRSL